jgi:hypothetical protein
MLTVEKDIKGEQIFIHGSPEKLRWLAAKLESIANYAESHGASHEHLMTPEWGGNELSSELQGKVESHSLVNHLIIYGWQKGGHS